MACEAFYFHSCDIRSTHILTKICQCFWVGFPFFFFAGMRFRTSGRFFPSLSAKILFLNCPAIFFFLKCWMNRTIMKYINWDERFDIEFEHESGVFLSVALWLTVARNDGLRNLTCGIFGIFSVFHMGKGEPQLSNITAWHALHIYTQVNLKY